MSTDRENLKLVASVVFSMKVCGGGERATDPDVGFVSGNCSCIEIENSTMHRLPDNSQRGLEISSGADAVGRSVSQGRGERMTGRRAAGSQGNFFFSSLFGPRH